MCGASAVTSISERSSSSAMRSSRGSMPRAQCSLKHRMPSASSRALASASGAPLYAALLGSEAAPLAAKLGMADKVFVADNPQLNLAPAATVTAALKAVMDQTQAGLVLLGCTNVSLGIGSILSAQTGMPLVNFCRAAKADGAAILLTTQLFGGKIIFRAFKKFIGGFA